jgi:hypothetical protein
VGELSLIRGFSGPPLHVYPVAYKEWPAFEYLDSNCGANLGGLGDKRNFVQGTSVYFYSFYRKGPIGVWYCNLRNL